MYKHLFFAAITLVAALPVHATLISVETPGNLLALLPNSDLNASSVNSYGLTTSQVVDNYINTSSQDDGQVFADNDTDQLLAITGFDSAVLDIRLYLDPTDPVRFPNSVTVYYSTLSTTSLDSSDSNYTGANGGELLPTTTLSASSITPVAGADSGPIDFYVDAPAGTQTLLFDFGPVTDLGIRVAEAQAFDSTPEPGYLPILSVFLIGFAAVQLRRRRFSGSERDAKMIG